MTEITVLYFGGLREALGHTREVVAFEHLEEAQLPHLYRELCRRHTRLPALMAGVRLALNEEFLNGSGQDLVARNVELAPGDVVAFLPPVTGG